MLPPWAIGAGGVALAALLAAVLWLPRRPRASEAIAAIALAYPVGSALAAALSVAERLTRYTVLLPASVEAFQRSIARDALYGLLLPLGAALVLWRARAGRSRWRGWRDLRAGLARVLEPAGLRLEAPDRAQALDAFAVTGVALALLALGLAAQQLLPAVVRGDESLYWTRLTPALLVGLSIAAGVSEEFVYRGLLLRALLRKMPGPWALGLQAAVFGFVHAGYGNWAHVLGPAIFGAIMGIVALRVGLLAAITAHAGIDIAYLALAAPHLQPAVLLLPMALLVLGLAALAATRGRAVRALLAGLPSRA